MEDMNADGLEEGSTNGILMDEELETPSSSNMDEIQVLGRSYAKALSTRFTWIDYLVFAIMLSFSAAIGVFYAFKQKKKNTDEFLLAGKSMSAFPVAMSLISR